MSGQESVVQSTDPEAKKYVLLFYALPIFLAFCGVMGMVISETYGDTAWYKALFQGDYGDGPYESRDGDQNLIGNPGVQSSSESGASESVSGVMPGGMGGVTKITIDGVSSVCATMNTDNYGYDEHFDPMYLEIASWDKMKELLAPLADRSSGLVTLIQGSEVTVLSEDDPKLDFLANKSIVCYPQLGGE